MHHSEDESQEISAAIRKAFDKVPFGATGKFPDGKLVPEDEGEIQFGITHYKGKVVLEFGKPVHWIGLDTQQARSLSRVLRKHANAALIVGTYVKDDNMKANAK